MSALDSLKFVKSIPKVQGIRGGKTEIERGREKLVGNLENQLRKAQDPKATITTFVTKKGSTGKQKVVRSIKSWVTLQGEDAYLTVRYSNKAMPLGGKKGSVIHCKKDEIVSTLKTIKQSVEAGEFDAIIEKMIKQSKRGNRKK